MTQFTIEKTPLMKALNLVGKAISSRPTHPALSNYKLTVENNVLTVQGTNLAVFVTANIALEPRLMPEKLEVLVNAKLFKSACDSSKETVSIEYLDEDTQLEVITHNARFKLATMDTDEYPEFPSVAEESVEINAYDFRQLISSVLYASATDETKQVLTGVNIKEYSEGLQSCATDGHRLAVFSSEIENCPAMNICLPSHLISLCKDVLPEKGLIEFAHDDVQAEIRINDGDIVICGRVLQGSYPQYEQLLPQNFNCSFLAEREGILDGLKSARIMSTDKNQLITFKIETVDSETGDSVIVLSSVTKEVGQAEVRVPISSVKGEIGNFGFNISYLTDAINSFSNKEIIFHLNDPNKPIMISQLGGLQPQLHGALLMPVQIREY